MPHSSSTLDSLPASAGRRVRWPPIILWLGGGVLMGIAGFAGWQSASHSFRTPHQAASPEVDRLTQLHLSGISIQPLTPDIVTRYKLVNDHGVVVAAVAPNTPWSDADLRKGDVILVLGNRPIRSESDFQSAQQALRVGPRTPVEVVREGIRITLSLQFNDRQLHVAKPGAD